jgi:hypothetical protein
MGQSSTTTGREARCHGVTTATPAACFAVGRGGSSLLWLDAFEPELGAKREAIWKAGTATTESLNASCSNLKNTERKTASN